jgi:type IX secretion system PorP/SprF family membrane protein
VFYKTDELYVGLSSTQVNAPLIEIQNEGATTNIPKGRHYYLTSGYNIYLPNPSFEIRPSFIVRSDGKLFDGEISGLLVYNKKLWGGLSYGLTDISSFGVAYIGLEFIENLNVGFAYGIPSANLNNFTSGSFEILLNYNFTLTKEKITKQYKSVRYL